MRLFNTSDCDAKKQQSNDRQGSTFFTDPTSNEERMTFDSKALTLLKWIRNDNHPVLGGPATKEG